MAFTDAPDAQRQLEAFLAECAARQVPLSSFQLSSGYSSSAAGRRHVFTWNSGKVPDPDGLAAAYAAAGVRLAANIKSPPPVAPRPSPTPGERLWPHAPAPRPARGSPAATELAPPRRPCLLVDHPEYAACAAAALFVGASGAASAAAAGAPPSSGAVFWPSTPSAAAYSPERSMFWDADGAPRAMRAARSARARTCVSDLSPAWPALRLAPRLYEPGRRRVVARPRGRGAAAARHRRHLE